MPDTSSPQFSTAEYSSKPSGDVCKVCGVPLTGTFYRANSAVVCGSCAERVKREAPRDNHARFMRALLFGLGGFLAALIAYSLVGILLRGWTIGYLSLGVGWIVGKAMITGSGGVGGRRYQIVAVLLTYAAVSMSAIPIGISLPDNASETKQSQQDAAKKSEQAAPAGQAANQAPPESKTEGSAKSPSLAAALGALALLGLASPFLELQGGLSGVIMLIILFVGMRFAWQMTAGRGTIEVTGPFEKPASASA